MTTITLGSGNRKVGVVDGSLKIYDRYGYGIGSAKLTVADRERIVDLLNSEIREPDLLEQFQALAVGDQFTLLSDRNAARGTVPSKAIKVDAETYFSYKHSALKKAADVLTGKPGSITKN